MGEEVGGSLLVFREEGELRTGLELLLSWSIRCALGESALCLNLRLGGLPGEDAGEGGFEGGFEDGGLGVGEWDGDFADGFVGSVLAGDGDEVGGALGIVAVDEFAGAAGLLGLVEELGLGLAALDGGKDGADIGERPFHDDLALPVELLFSGLGGGLDKDGGLLLAEAKTHDTTGTAGVWLVDGVVRGALEGGSFWTGIGR